MSKSKKIVFVILSALVCVFTMCFSFFNLHEDTTLYVKADSITTNYTYEGSVIYIPIRRNVETSNQIYCDLLVWDCTLSSGSNVVLDINNVSMLKFVAPYTSGSSYNYSNLHHLVSFGSSYSESNKTTTLSAGQYNLTLRNSFNDYYAVNYTMDSGFTADIASIEMGNYGNNNYYWNYIKYFDTNGKTLRIMFCIREILTTDELLNQRTYYLKTDLNDNQAYSQGYSQGLLDNQQNIYDNGYNAGQTVGYNNGYNDGINYTDQYSFYNLFGALLDAPIATLTGLLNFNLFGVNLLSLFTGLLTLAIILLVLRLIRGGK